MTVSSSVNKVIYSGNSATVLFPVSYYFLENSHLKVILRAADGTETVQALTTNYTVTGAGNTAGGSVTMLVAPPTGTTLTIVRNVPATQETDYLANDPFPAESHERALDKLTMLVQENEEVMGRALVVPASTPSTVSTTLPNPSPLGILAWNQNANAINYISPSDIGTAVAYATAYADTFDCDGVDQTFTLTANPVVINNLDVSINGSTQVPNVDYTLSGTTLTMTTPPPVNSVLLAKYKQGLPNFSGDSQDIRYVPAGTGAVATTVQTKLRETVSVKDFGAVGDGVADDTAAVQAAINTNKSVYFPQGIYLVDEITVPTAARGSTYYGDGYYHYSDNQKTVIKAKTLSQNSVFLIATGADNITFSLMRIDGASKADKCVDAAFGAFLSFVQCGVYSGVSYGVYSKQGLMRIDRCFMAGSGVAQCHMWSDSSATDSEFTGGAVGLLMAAGGNRIVNIWANSCTNACIALRPFDNSINHINTSIVNLYAGEVSGVSRPVIDIVGTALSRVQQVHISNSFIVTAVAAVNKIDGGVYIEYAQDVSIDNVQFRGLGLSSTPTSYTPWSIFGGTNVDGLTVSNCTFRDINRNPIYLDANIGSVTITGCLFQDWDTDENAVGAEAAAIRISSGRVTVTGNNFFIGGGQTQPYVLQVADAKMVNFDNNYMAMPTPTLAAATGTVSGLNRYTTSGAYEGRNLNIASSVIETTTVNNSGQNYLSTGTVASLGSGVAETLNVVTLANTAAQQTYIATASQQGGSSNTVVFLLNAFGASAKAVRISGDTASPGANALDFQFTGLQLQLVVGSAYGATTWRWAITRLI